MTDNDDWRDRTTPRQELSGLRSEWGAATGKPVPAQIAEQVAAGARFDVVKTRGAYGFQERPTPQVTATTQVTVTPTTPVVTPTSGAIPAAQPAPKPPRFRGFHR